MTVRFLRTISLLASMLAFAVAANAQSEVITVHVPFTFVAGGKLLPAGDYRLDKEESSNVLLMHGGPGNSATFLTMAVDTFGPAKNASLVFAREGGTLVLSAIRLPGQQSRVVLPSHVAAKSVATASPMLH